MGLATGLRQYVCRFFLNRVNVMVSGGYLARCSSERGCCLPGTRRLPELGIKKSDSGPAFAPCPAMELIAKSHSWLLTRNTESRIFSGWYFELIEFPGLLYHLIPEAGVQLP